MTIREFVYPDRGGYTGFSICIFETNYKTPGSHRLTNPWGGVEGTEKLKPSEYVLEGRFFVFGVLLKRILIAENSLEEIERVFDKLTHGWSPLMDEVKKRERDWSLKKRGGLSTADIIDDELRKSLELSQ